MPLFTIIARVTSPLILVESFDTDSSSVDLRQLKAQAKKIIESVSRSSQKCEVITAKEFYFIYVVEEDICYLTLCDASYPKKLAYLFLEDIKKEFFMQHGSEVGKTKRPFAFELFDTFIQKTKTLYMDTKSARNLKKVTADLNDINKIMQRSINDIFDRSAKFSDVAARSHDLGAQAQKYATGAKDLHNKYWWRTWGPIAGAVAFFLLLFIFRFVWYS